MVERNSVSLPCQFLFRNITRVLVKVFTFALYKIIKSMNALKDYAQLTHQVRCANPRIIINPLLPELMAQYGDCMLNGQYIHWPKSTTVRLRYNFPYKLFSVKRNGINHDNLSDSYVIDMQSGETFPVYMEVPCNHCNICKMRKVNGFVQRCELETCLYDYKPWFITLTYDQLHVPTDGVSVRDAQLFLKRFRINLVRAGFDEHIRYVMVGEYGKNTHRPHYHCLVWNIQSSTLVQYKKVTEIIDRSWQMGFTQRRLVNPGNNASFYYTVKYLKKSQDEAAVGNRNKPFVNSSKGTPGGIGSGFLDSVADTIRDSKNIRFKFYNRWQGKVKELFFSQYVLNRIFPSWCRSIPSEFRTALSSYALAFSKFKIMDDVRSEMERSLFRDYYQNRSDEILMKHGKFVWCGPIDSKNVLFWDDVHWPGDNVTHIMDECLKLIDKYSIDDEVYIRARRLHDLRQVFMAKLFENMEPIDIDYEEWRCKQMFEASKDREVL